MIRICIPGNAYTPGFFRSWTEFVHHLAKTEHYPPFTFSNFYSPLLAHGRNELLLAGQKPVPTVEPFGGAYDWVFFLETDIVFTPEDFLALYIAATEKSLDVVTGLFPMNAANPDAAVAGWNEEGRVSMTAAREQGPGLTEIDFAGIGFMLIRRGVLERLGYPWFCRGTIYGHQDGLVWYRGDDFDFCRRIRDAGYTIHAHTGVLLGHEKRTVVTG